MNPTLATIVGIVSITGVLIAGGSFIWQITGRRKSGRLVSVRSAYSIPVYGPPEAPEFHGDDQVSVTVTNRGGAPVTVTNYGVALGRTKDRNMFVRVRPWWATALPATLDPGGTPVIVLVPVKDLRDASKELAIPLTAMRAWVDLGDGRRVYSKNSVPLKE